MKRSSIKEVVRTLNKLRDQHHDQLGASELSELNAVIEQLEQAASAKPGVPLWDLANRALRIIGTVIEIIHKIKGGS